MRVSIPFLRVIEGEQLLRYRNAVHVHIKKIKKMHSLLDRPPAPALVGRHGPSHVRLFASSSSRDIMIPAFLQLTEC